MVSAVPYAALTNLAIPAADLLDIRASSSQEMTAMSVRLLVAWTGAEQRSSSQTLVAGGDPLFFARQRPCPGPRDVRLACRDARSSGRTPDHTPLTEMKHADLRANGPDRPILGAAMQ